MNVLSRSGQSLMELLVGIAVGGIFIVGAATIIAPSLRINNQAGVTQMESQLGQELLNNTKAWAAGNWNNLLALSTGTTKYYLNTTASPFASQIPTGGTNWSNGYGYRRTITIDYTKVSNTTQTNFPMLFQGTYPTLANVANGGHVNNVNGYDIIFTSDASGTVPLNYERESYSSSTGQMTYWVKIPSLSAATNTIIYLFYGNASVSSDQSNKTGTWDSNYVAVWHLDESLSCSAGTCDGSTGAGKTAYDSTTNGNNLGVYTSSSAWTTSQTVSGNFNNAIQIIPTPSIDTLSQSPVSSSLKLSSNATLEYWVNRTDQGLENDVLGTLPNANYDFLIFNDKMYFFSDSGSGLADTATISNGVWNLLTFVKSSTIGSFYLNGTFNSSGSVASTLNTSDTSFFLGCNRNADPCMNGNIDEARVSNIARSSDWVKTEYNNENSPSSFYSLGFEVPYSASGGSLAGELITVNNTTYARYFTVSDVYRTPASSTATSTVSGNYYDPSTKQISVYVGMSSSTIAPISFNFYVTRNVANVLNQSTWIGGSGFTNAATIVTSTYASSSNISLNGGSLQLSGGATCVY